MHLLAAQPGRITDGSEAVDLGQDPADILFLSAADTELACLAAARAAWPGAPSVRAANLTLLGHPLSVDLWVDRLACRARLVVVRLLGGRGYWPHGVDRLTALARAAGPAGPLLALVPGDSQPDVDLARASTLPAAALHRLWRYWVEGGVENAGQFLRYAASLIGCDTSWQEPAPLPVAGLLGPDPPRPAADPTLPDSALPDSALPDPALPDPRPRAAVIFYRALVQAGDLAPVTALTQALDAEGLCPLPIYCSSLKDPVAAAMVETLLARHRPAVIVTLTGFAVSRGPTPAEATPAEPPCAPSPRPSDRLFAASDAVVVQAVLSSGDEEGWREGSTGLPARDIAMGVALPEVDGRLFSRAISFKAAEVRDPDLQIPLARHRPIADRVTFVARLAAGWARLRTTPPGARRVALILGRYPNRAGRLAHGVGLDTPAATAAILARLAGAGYDLGSRPRPADGAAVMALLAEPPDPTRKAHPAERLSGAAYAAFFARLPQEARDRVLAHWGPPEADPAWDAIGGGFVLPAVRLGRVALGIQPTRVRPPRQGAQSNPATTSGDPLDAAGYHDPLIPPPHGYIAFYAWLHGPFGAQALIHLGKHGTLEWLPGKALALSETCFPELLAGPLPHLYPFLVNDPGEGTQAKRRTQAVIVDHLTPPLTRAETYGPLRDLESLVDEYFEAASLDPRRLGVLGREIIALAERAGLLADLGLAPDDDDAAILAALDGHLCDLKELQIRDGLHIFGQSPTGRARTDLLVALARAPRGPNPGDASLIRALARDLGLSAPPRDPETAAFDPLAAPLGAAWTGPRPPLLAGCAPDPWRTTGDTVERLEILAAALVAGERAPDPAWTATLAVLETIRTRLAPAVDACGPREGAALLAGLDGRFIAPGPSGAPTRGRPDVLPTGRNFYSVDGRALPSPAAWTLGWQAATVLLERHLQDHGDWPRALVLSAWGTAAMRTGGDDVAQALALLGCRPTWDPHSARVTGFEILPLAVLDRPRVDVTVRVSGFFRDAFPGLIDLLDSAVRAVADQGDEPEHLNPLAARVRREATRLAASGLDPETARRQAGHRIFGAPPGGYGAGLQGLIDENAWDSDADLARAYVAWGGHAYGNGAGGEAAQALFQARLATAEAVLQAQDTREHDLLDSGEYAQFEGGAALAVRVLSGQAPVVYHSDTSQPDTVRVRTLEEEIARIVRARVVNPKWIASALRHGYKGAADLAATVDYMVAFAVTTRAVRSHHFDLVADAYLLDPVVRHRLEAVNPGALRDIARRLQEVQSRGLWRPRRNSLPPALAALAEGGAWSEEGEGEGQGR